MLKVWIHALLVIVGLPRQLIQCCYAKICLSGELSLFKYNY